jgi:hypothetical protein
METASFAVSMEDMVGNSLRGAEFGDSHGGRGNLYALGFHSWADPNSATPVLVGKLGNLAECHSYHHDVSFAVHFAA